ncbi:MULTISPECIES: LysR family transcriptional regulator [Paraburkholderia]|uniref:LysR family transcriptional regulator n=1 Tax=Paraburkholderia TaxID=1822464 RepID=UPI00224C96A6|nr:MULTISPECIES: LysR family transcriptional regulator [Paraburkholderia]MCX4164960.1 LysR family transcriptional regulator [Paraburkholderia megapolitana]MDN7160453.1 LysR family transcriptional regulator [Paraburkholderia sp. CHISQ3]MDQ6497500.1 LysR family transcriptional regulator [Paraburkholderia megapolitana]
MTNLDIDLLRTFVTIADTRSLTRTATEVGRTQSAISMQVRRIEEVAGGAVLLRTVRGVELTARGETLLRHARELLRIHDEALAELTGRSLSGAIRFGCPDDYCITFLPSLLREIAGRHPRVAVHLVCASTTHLRRMLRDKRIDLALISLAPGDDGEAAVRYEKLVWVGAHARAAEHGDASLALALSEPDTLDHQAARRALDGAGIAYHVACESASKDGLLAMVRAGIAITVLTEGAVPADLTVLDTQTGLPALPSFGMAIASAHGSGDSLLVGSLKVLLVDALGAA